MRVFLLNPPFPEGIIRDNFCCHTQKADYIWAPSDLLYISGILRGDPFEVTVKDAVMEPEGFDDILARCKRWQPDAIICLTSSASYQSDLAGLEKITSEVGARAYVIGNLVSFEPKRILERYEWLDGVLHNMLDVRIRDFLLDPENPSKTISCRKADGSLVLGEVNGIDRKDCPLDVPPPQYELFPNAKYSTPLARAHPQTTVLTATGCPYSCSFCIYGPMKLFRRSIESLRAEFEACRENGIRELYVVDPTFNADLAFMREICDLIISENFDLSWACRIHPDRVSLEDMQHLKAAGCHTIQIGVESKSAETLKQIAPSKEEQMIRRCFSLANQAGLRTLGYFIIGHPGETRAQALDTINFAIDLDPMFASFSNYMPLNGTKSHDTAVDLNQIEDEFQTFDLNGAPIEFAGAELNAEERRELLRIAYRKFYLRPRQVAKYLRDYRNIPIYLKNGTGVIWNQIVG